MLASGISRDDFRFKSVWDELLRKCVDGAEGNSGGACCQTELGIGLEEFKFPACRARIGIVGYRAIEHDVIGHLGFLAGV